MNWTAIGAVSAMLAVGLGAFGAHGLEGRLEPRMLIAFEIGVRYQMVHALALLVVGLLGHSPGAGWCFLIGTLFFSGSLYGLSLTGAKFFGPITPLGGLLFMVGWGILAYGALTRAG